VVRLAALVLALTVAAPLAAGRAAPDPPGAWREAPEYLPLFAAAGERQAAYRAYVSPRGLDEALRELGVTWPAREQLPRDAFGETGRYDRLKLVRLYGATRARVARGPRSADGRVTEAWTLVSPYPDPALGRLEAGTLLIVLSLTP
jgi:hypothetical protein